MEGFDNGISTSEIGTLAVETCAYVSQRHHDFSTLAARIAVANLHKNTSDSFTETIRAMHRHQDKQGRAASLISDEVASFVDARAPALDATIDYLRDCDHDHFGFKALEKSYLSKLHGRIVERPSPALVSHVHNFQDTLQ